jgi:thiosulfate/3-mercaptopyruvate sulfurtransferase
MILQLPIFISVILIFTACQQKPTKVYQSPEIKNATQKNADEPSEIQITEKMVIVDARPAFDYSVAHLSGSINLRPEDFTQREKPFIGLLENDLYFHSRKLARMGIGPETPVLVVGRGISGKGEEGRVAWTLKYMGLKNVQFAAIDNFKLPLVNVESEPKAPVTLWKPDLQSSLLVNRKEFIKHSMKPHADVVIIDARPVNEYLGKIKTEHVKSAPDIGAINIPWTDFFDLKGRLNSKVKEKLMSVGITENKEIFVIGNQGIESAAVTLALRDLGYKLAANYAGGYVELLAFTPRK